MIFESSDVNRKVPPREVLPPRRWIHPARSARLKHSQSFRQHRKAQCVSCNHPRSVSPLTTLLILSAIRVALCRCVALRCFAVAPTTALVCLLVEAICSGAPVPHFEADVITPQSASVITLAHSLTHHIVSPTRGRLFTHSHTLLFSSSTATTYLLHWANHAGQKIKSRNTKYRPLSSPHSLLP